MLDITSFIREKIFRLPKINTTNCAGEEITEKQTTKLGYFLLYCMFITILISAQWTLGVIKEIPNKPTPIPNCIENMISVLENGDNYSFFEKNNYYYDNEYNSCNLISENPKYDFTSLYDSLNGVVREINNHGDTLNGLKNKRSELDYQKKNAQDDYNTALTEIIAQEEQKTYNTNTSRNIIENSRIELNKIDNDIESIQSKIGELRTIHTSETLVLKETLKEAKTAYWNAYLLYRFFVGVLSLIFAGITFAILYRIYVRQKIKNSPHTIIFSVATFAYGLVLVQIVSLFLWDIIPHKIFELLLNFLTLFTPLLYLVQFLWPILIIVIFGFLIVRIQKRLYSPENILKRFISDKKCPNCGNGVDFTKPFCPLCSHEIQISCPHCNELTIKGMPYCSNCGGKIITTTNNINTHG